MLSVIFFVICFLASSVGAICGIGGGVIIKPVLDSFHVMDVDTISFLAGVTVLSMTTYSVIKSKVNEDSAVTMKTSFPLALGSAFGGLIGKEMFSAVCVFFSDKDKVGAIQAGCLLIVTMGTLVYTIYKDHIRTMTVDNVIVCIMIGSFLGLLSSFLGIGGGPINLVVLFFFFSMTTKIAAENSLYIIFFSQIASIVSSIFTKSVPDFSAFLLVPMVIGGIAGGMFGRAMNKKLEEKTVDRLFVGLMIIIIIINIYNIYVFTG